MRFDVVRHWFPETFGKNNKVFGRHRSTLSTGTINRNYDVPVFFVAKIVMTLKLKTLFVMTLRV